MLYVLVLLEALEFLEPALQAEHIFQLALLQQHTLFGSFWLMAG